MEQRIKATIVVILIGVLGCDASHFRGGSIFWKQSKSGDTIDIDYRESWRRTSQTPMCNETVISDRINSSSEGQLAEVPSMYYDGYRPLFSDAFAYVCTDYSLLEDWQSGRGHIDFPLNISSRKTSYTLQFTGCCWIGSLVYGGDSHWKLQITMDTRVRSDTGRMNASPRVDFPPIIRVQYGCNHTINIPVGDEDNDIVRCRWATQEESAGVYRSFPNAVLHHNCSITYAANYQLGWYPVAIQIEDFANTTSNSPLSSIPLQFLVSVEKLNASCNNERPKFVNFTLPDKACIGVMTDTDFLSDIYIQSGSNSSISEVNTVSPIGLVKSSLQRSNQTGHWHISVQWNPNSSNSINNVFCFTAVDDNGLSSDQRCITLLAGVPAAEIIRGSQMPAITQVTKTQTVWSVEFNRPDKPAARSAYIYLYLSNGTLVEAINVLTSPGVTYTYLNNRTRIHFTTSSSLLPGQGYYFLFGQGLVQGTEYCGAESKPVLDPFFWRFTVNPEATIPIEHVSCFEGQTPIACKEGLFNCTESWSFTSPCTQLNKLHNQLKFPYPGAQNKFILCDLAGKTYVGHCPPYEIFYEQCSTCNAIGITPC
ncbi:integrin beta-like protein C isoform X2 [Dreissena polymorpha]|uniref:integrin beta-like protein C isoform X2 n=1 Tax=Dreissena polymorpha TaxID=45954 RepID=UPI00226422D3|nr:integrin beta-like protein C isoform X2 [Dreissena polymorpha]